MHEAYLRMADQADAAWKSREHFVAVASQVIRRVLVDHARRHEAVKRGGGNQRVELGTDEPDTTDGVDILALDGALQDLEALDDQQRRIVDLLQGHAVLSETRSLDKEGWVSILRAAGLDDEDMMRWHVEFERLSPQAHQDFLENLGLDEEEISSVREASKGC